MLQHPGGGPVLQGGLEARALLSVCVCEGQRWQEEGGRWGCRRARDQTGHEQTAAEACVQPVTLSCPHSEEPSSPLPKVTQLGSGRAGI